MMRRILRNKPLFLGGVIILAIVVVAVFAPFVAPQDPYEMNMRQRLDGPSRKHWLGTDNFGRDLWARMTYGARFSVLIATISVAISAGVGTSVGLVAGYYGGWIDLLTMRIVDVVLGFPILILALALVAALGAGAKSIIIALIFVFWGQYARVVRSVVLVERERAYVEAARAIGTPSLQILYRHILRNSWGSVVVLASLGMGTAILTETALSFLGFGALPPKPTWGWTLAYGMRYLRDAPVLSLVPGIAIMLTVLGFNLLGDGLRNFLDPRSMRR